MGKMKTPTQSKLYVSFLFIMGIIILMLAIVAIMGAADINRGCFIDPSGHTPQNYLHVGYIAGFVGLLCLIIPFRNMLKGTEVKP